MNNYRVTVAMKTSATGDRVFPLTFYNVYADSVEEAEKEGYKRFIDLIEGQINGTITDISVYACIDE